MSTLLKNEIYTVEIESYNSEAMGVCRINDRAVFVPNTIVGEIWEIKILKVSSAAVYGKALKPVRTSPDRIDPVCPHFGKCGGCNCQHMSYSEELRFKLEKVNNALSRIGKQKLSAKEIIGSDNVLNYRNKAIFAIDEIDEKPTFGFYRQRSHDLIAIDKCYIQSELSCRLAKAVTDFMDLHHVPAYNEETGKGIVRHVFCRHSCHGNDAVACIVSARGFGANTQKLVDHLRTACPELTGIVLNVNKTHGNTVLTGDFYTLWGNDKIEDSLCSLRYEIAPQAFFQINPPQAEKLYQKAVEFALENKPKLVFDLYCGAGTISLCLAKNAERVIGCEIVPEAIENANKNAAFNGLQNVEFICADAGEAATELANRSLKPDALLVDPPRKGMDEKAIEATASMKPERIVYVSCDCATLSRDILRFSQFGYVLKEVVAVDMFPRTAHIETVVLLSREKADDYIRISVHTEDLKAKAN